MAGGRRSGQRRAGRAAAQMTQATELTERQQAGKAFHGVLLSETECQSSPERISPTAMPSSAKSALPALTKMFS